MTTTAAPSPPEECAALWPLHLAGFVATYIFSIGNVAAPDMARELRTDAATVTLSLGAFAACFAAGLIVAGRLGDRYGRHLLFAAGLAAGVVTSVASALAPTIVLLIAARCLQGVASAVVMPQILATIQSTRTGTDRLTAIAVFSASSGVGTAAGQVIGGALISANVLDLGWRLAFWSVAALTVLALVGARQMPRTRVPESGGVDLVGSVLAGGSLLALVAGLTLGPSRHWPLWSLGILVGALAGLGVFWAQQVRRERAGRPTLTPPSVVTLPALRLGLLIALVFFGGFGAFMYDYALLTQTGLRLPPIVTGGALGLFAVAFALTSVNIGRFTARLGERTIQAGAAAQGVCLLLLAATVWADGRVEDAAHLLWWLQPVLLPLGVAQALIFAPLVSAVMHAVPHEVAGLTGGLVSTAQQAALALGVALVGTAYVAAAAAMGWVTAFAATLIAQAVLSVVLFLAAGHLRRARAT